MATTKKRPAAHASQDRIEVKSNLSIIARERGKIKARRDGHNIFLDTGREWLAKLCAYLAYAPALAPEEDRRIRYMGFGIGGVRQSMLGVANAAPLVTAYPGTNAYTDEDPTLTRLERPVRISGGTSAYPYDGADVWLAQVQAPAGHTTPRQVTYSRLITKPEISYSTFLTVPLSEIGLFYHDPSLGYVNTYNNPPVAYDTFDPLSKTLAVTVEVNWTLRF